MPADEGPRDSGIEWWYFNGLLKGDQGREFSYHYVTFQSERAGYGSLVSSDGSMSTLDQDYLSITSSEVWVSPTTGIEYPSNWTVIVPSLELSLKLEPVLPYSEFSGSRYTPTAYWEGEVRVSGTRKKEAVSGRGFVELVGYDPSQLKPIQLHRQSPLIDAGEIL